MRTRRKNSPRVGECCQPLIMQKPDRKRGCDVVTAENSTLPHGRVSALIFSRHSRQRQSRYLVLRSARTSSLKLISEHQHPRKLAPHEKSLPHASHVTEPARRGETNPTICVSLLIYAPPRLRWELPGRGAALIAQCVFRPRRQLPRRVRESLTALPGAARCPSARSPGRQW